MVATRGTSPEVINVLNEGEYRGTLYVRYNPLLKVQSVSTNIVTGVGLLVQCLWEGAAKKLKKVLPIA